MPELEEVELFSEFLFQIRLFFKNRNFLEVETPLLNSYTTPEPYIDSFVVESNFYLIPSPEFNLKILLNHYKRNLFQISHAFRKGDKSPLHNREFLLLEWYHIGYNDDLLILEIVELLKFLSNQIKGFNPVFDFSKKTVNEIFNEFLQMDYSKENLITIIESYQLVEKKNFEFLNQESYDVLFYLVFLNLIEPKLNTENPLFITNYPKELRAYSKLKNQKESSRFELFWKGLEIGNGFHEITNREEQYLEFQANIRRRLELNKPIYPLSMTFFNSFPLVECAGVAIGLERLFMAFRNLKKISQISFCDLWN
ncbi:MAG: amino acid--tRNA ligase-related protein [Leptonema sp. (in: bacteria)]